ncbi:hypothetical protein P4N68_04975 [Corynebacterium felinum]|uniref:Secreted protein n=1 Tax=Corynebacterium felinum TaxID=131318 RepID=A0ABU2BBV7_9CORY|nr:MULTISPECIES: hypothetical protein [Corynebacterium]MDF5820432.1 hypothetical protein [Corynebacterium felinum]MDO4762352.1 hypothetical protein [Corynebacterium sp.]MDR7355469.1 hypothetical protein [Corynebacterium felinum]WJY94820.1 hypothetical protein CFELI_05990 [Corynebacterium felinum]
MGLVDVVVIFGVIGIPAVVVGGLFAVVRRNKKLDERERVQSDSSAV